MPCAFLNLTCGQESGDGNALGVSLSNPVRSCPCASKGSVLGTLRNYALRNNVCRMLLQNARGLRMTTRELITMWRTDAGMLERYGDDRGANLLKRAATDLECALRAEEDELLDLDAAAQESGYSKDRLRHMVAEGTVPNAGRRHAPRVRRGDLPRKRSRSSQFDAAATARAITGAQ